MSLHMIMSVLAVHWLADFVLQSDWQAKNKSKSNYALTLHVGTYTICLVAFGLCIFSIEMAIYWALLNGVMHFGVDYVTSRINTYLWSKGEVHNFFVSVGLDQLIHYACLFGTLTYFGV